MEEKEVVKTEEKNALDDKGFAMMYNITMVSAAATVAMFVIAVSYTHLSFFPYISKFISI